MASTSTTPEALSRSLFIYTALGAVAFVAAVIVYVFFNFMN